MSPIRRELLNGVFVLVVASLLSAAFTAFQIGLNIQLWVLILMAVAIAAGFYIVFELTVGFMASSGDREKEWLKRVGTPAQLVLERGDQTFLTTIDESVEAMSPDDDYTAMYYFGSEGGAESPLGQTGMALLPNYFGSLLDRLKQGKLRQYKRIICFDRNVLVNDPELRSGTLSAGVGPGTVDKAMAEHCRLMLQTKGCSLYVAPAVFRATVLFFGMSKVSITLETAGQDTGGRTTAGTLFFNDPPNGEIIEQFRQMERETERRMVAVHKIVFPEDAMLTKEVASR